MGVRVIVGVTVGVKVGVGDEVGVIVGVGLEIQMEKVQGGAVGVAVIS